MKLTKKRFCEIMQKLQEVNALQHGINNMIWEAENKLKYAIVSDSVFPVVHEDLVVDLLEYLMDDKEGQWIGYFMYELDYGEGWKPGTVMDGEKDVDLSSAEKLYDFLEEEKKRHASNAG